tara:strand:+ start:305 stop:1168 length:864 start_codon:yes stop_codon:yes gene_type:complete
MPQVVISERAAQIHEAKYYNTLRGVGNEDTQIPINEALHIEETRIRLTLIKNGAKIIEREQSHDRYARAETGVSPPFDSGTKKNDYRDAMICKAIFEVAEENTDRKIYAVSTDKGARDRLTTYNDTNPKPANQINVFEHGHKFIAKIIDTYTDCPISVVQITGEDLRPVEAPHFRDRQDVEREEQLSGFDMEDSLREMAERLQISQKCLMATTHLMFPATDKQSVSDKMQSAWGFDLPETEGAAQFLIRNGFLEDLSGTYIVRHDDFAMQAIESIGEDVNRLLEVLD